MEENVQFDRISKGLRGVVEYAECLETLESRFDSREIKIPKRANLAKRSPTDIRRAIPKLGKLTVAAAIRHYPNEQRIALSMAKLVAIPATSAKH